MTRHVGARMMTKRMAWRASQSASRPRLALSTTPRILPYMIRKVQSTAIALLLATHASCLAPSDDGAEPAVLQPQKPAEIPTYSYRVVCAFPHDPTAFTQGLLYDNGFLYESTGQYGQSTLRKVELETGTVVQLHQLDERFFAEGACPLRQSPPPANLAGQQGLYL